MLYFIDSFNNVPKGVEYRQIASEFNSEDHRCIIETEVPVEGLELAPDVYSNGVKILDYDFDPDNGGCIADWRLSDGDPATEDIKTKAEKIFAQIKPLAYENPLAVKQAMNETFTPEEIQGVFGAE